MKQNNDIFKFNTHKYEPFGCYERDEYIFFQVNRYYVFFSLPKKKGAGTSASIPHFQLLNQVPSYHEIWY
jgi:hypothetical protein